MAFNDNISSAVQQFVFTQSNGEVTQPVNGSYMQAYCEWLGITESVNDSWLQALCIYEGITEPLHGSWTVALANFYGLTYPTGGTWWMALSEATPPAPVDLIWNEVLTEWQLETTPWAVAPAPNDPTFNDVTVSLPLVPLEGTASPLNRVTIVVDGKTYVTDSDALGDYATVSEFIQGTAGTGTAFPVSVSTMSLATGVMSATIIGEVTVIDVTVDLTIVMESGWNNAWVYSGISLQVETNPGVWALVEYDGNPGWWDNPGNTGTFKNYKDDNSRFGLVMGPYIAYYCNYDPDDPTGNGLGPVSRVWSNLFPGNYRIIGATPNGTPAYYAEYMGYTILKQGLPFLPLKDDLVTADFAVLPNGVTQQTFTL